MTTEFRLGAGVRTRREFRIGIRSRSSDDRSPANHGIPTRSWSPIAECRLGIGVRHQLFENDLARERAVRTELRLGIGVRPRREGGAARPPLRRAVATTPRCEAAHTRRARCAPEERTPRRDSAHFAHPTGALGTSSGAHSPDHSFFRRLDGTFCHDSSHGV